MTNVSGIRLRRSRLDTAPPEWKIMPLGSIATSQYGVSEPASQYGVVPMIGMSSVNGGDVSTITATRIDLDSKQLELYTLRVEDILFNRTNSYDLVGKTAIVRRPPIEPTVFASYLVRLNVNKERALPEFICYYMNSYNAFCRFKALATPGVSQYNINPTSLLEEFLVPIPALEEQAEIVRILRTVDGTTSQTERLVELQQSLKTGLMQTLLVGKRRFTESQGLRWKQFHLGELFAERSESNRTDLPLLSITGNRGVISRDELNRKDSSSKDKSQYKRIAPGDIGYNTMRMWQGVSALSRLEGIVSPAYTVCVPNEEIDGLFASYLFKSPAIVHLFRRYSQGMVDDTLSLKFPNFAQIKVTIPSLAEQKRIAATLSTLDQQIDLLRKMVGLFKQQKRGLMQKLLTGEMRVKASDYASEATS